MQDNDIVLPRVVIIGAGFGGLRAARAFGGKDVLVELIDRNNYHLFQPLLYQVATAGLEPGQIAKPIRSILRNQENLTFCLAEVNKVDLENRMVFSTAGKHPYDFLVIASGAAPQFFGRTALADYALAVKGLADAIDLRNHILTQFELASRESNRALRSEYLTFAVVGAGPTGVEMVGALVELIFKVLVKNYREIDFNMVRVVLIEAEMHVLLGMPSSLSQAAKRMLERKGIEIRLETIVEDFNGRVIRFDNGETLSARTLIWSVGVQASRLTRQLNVPKSPQNRILVEPTLQIKAHPEVFVVGDAAYREESGHPLPMMAPVALRMADCAVENILRRVDGEELQSFAYRDPGTLATIGRNAAVANIRGFQFKGFIAWVVWLIVHLIQLIGFRNRLMVLINWAWSYFTYDQAVRLIAHRPPGTYRKEEALKARQRSANERVRVGR